MTIPIPAGHHVICPTCDGAGERLRDRAALKHGTNRLGTAVVGERCRPCEGTGWIPPRHPPKAQGQDDEES